jgi:anti-anti-sigma factor
MSLADVEYRVDGDALVAHVSGEIDMSNAGAIVDAVAKATPNDVGGVVLDLTGIEYLDSAGIHMIYRLRDGLRIRGQGLAVILGPSSPVHDALQLAGVKELVDLVDSVDEALSLLKNHEKHTASA